MKTNQLIALAIVNKTAGLNPKAIEKSTYQFLIPEYSRVNYLMRQLKELWYDVEKFFDISTER